MPAVKKKKVEEVKTEAVEVEVNTESVEENAPEEVKAEKPQLKVDTAPVDRSVAPVENVRVKMKKDIKFNFGGERYDLKAGQCYNVPHSVKLHLNRKDVLSPL